MIINKEFLAQFQRLQPRGVTIQNLEGYDTDQEGLWLSFSKGGGIISAVERLYRDDCEGLAAALAALPDTATKADVIRALDGSGLRVVGHGLWDSTLEEFEQ